jgi:hypothetical protein
MRTILTSVFDDAHYTSTPTFIADIMRKTPHTLSLTGTDHHGCTPRMIVRRGQEFPHWAG